MPRLLGFFPSSTPQKGKWLCEPFLGIHWPYQKKFNIYNDINVLVGMNFFKFCMWWIWWLKHEYTCAVLQAHRVSHWLVHVFYQGTPYVAKNTFCFSHFFPIQPDWKFIGSWKSMKNEIFQCISRMVLCDESSTNKKSTHMIVSTDEMLETIFFHFIEEEWKWRIFIIEFIIELSLLKKPSNLLAKSFVSSNTLWVVVSDS